jgi:hypothetical protein
MRTPEQVKWDFVHQWLNRKLAQCKWQFRGNSRGGAEQNIVPAARGPPDVTSGTDD